MGYGVKMGLVVILFCAVAVPASAAASVFEGFRGSFLRAFIAYAVLFVSAHVASFVLVRLGVTNDEDVTKNNGEDD